MKAFAQVINEETKACLIGSGTNEVFYEKIGMTEQEIEQGYDGKWYMAGYAPKKPAEITAEEKRAERDKFLAETDKVMIADYPVSDETRELYRLYRAYLRDLPAQADFPDVDVLNFKNWREQIHAKEPEVSNE